MIVKLIHRPESAFRFYLDDTLDRFEYHLQNGDFPDDDEREEERLELYELLTDQQRQQVWGLSADLYSLLDNEQSPSDHQKLSPKQIAEKLQSSYQMSDWTEVLSLLRLQTGTIRRSVIDCMRYRAWSELGFPNIALAFIKNAIRLDPTDFGYKHLALELLKKMKDWESLAEHSQKYVAQCPDDVGVLLEGWIQEWPTHPEFYGARGMIRLTMDYDLAIVDFKEAVELGTQSVLPYIEYANWLLHEGRHSEAIVVAENGLRSAHRNSDQAKLLHLNSIARAMTNDCTRAIVLMREAMRRDPTDLDISSNLKRLEQVGAESESSSTKLALPAKKTQTADDLLRHLAA